MNNNDMIIIGGGLGGLTTGALLAKEGWQVTVLEKNHIVGGGLQNFSRHGIHFDTGISWADFAPEKRSTASASI